jgi:hypothetical protein
MACSVPMTSRFRRGSTPPKGSTLAALVSHYRQHGLLHLHQEVIYFSRLKTLREAMTSAASARMNGRKLSHQWRLPNALLAKAAGRLVKHLAAIDTCENFNGIFKIVDSVRAQETGLGDLWAYDTSFRIGAKLEMFPTEVFLQSGARRGAVALEGRRISNARSAASSLFRPELSDLNSHEIENFLCIYKNRLTENMS